MGTSQAFGTTSMQLLFLSHPSASINTHPLGVLCFCDRSASWLFPAEKNVRGGGVHSVNVRKQHPHISVNTHNRHERGSAIIIHYVGRDVKRFILKDSRLASVTYADFHIFVPYVHILFR